MASTFNGRDVSIHFKEDPGNQAVRQYRVEWQCANTSISHYIDVLQSDGEDSEGNRTYTDILTYAENEAAGLTRFPTCVFYSQDADGRWSAGNPIPLVNPISVFSIAPNIVPSIDGVVVQVTQPLDRDLEGYVAWVSNTPSFPLDSTTERYRGKATQFPIPLTDMGKYYIRVAPFDAFGIDLASAWPVQVAERAAEVRQPAAELSQWLNQTINRDVMNTVSGLIANDSFSRTLDQNFSDQFDIVQTQREELAASLGVVDAKIVSEIEVRVSQNGAMTTRMDTLEANAGGALGLIEEEAIARADEDNALAQLITNLTTRVGTAEGTISTEVTNRTNADASLQSLITNLTGRVGTTETNISTEVTNRTNADSALQLLITNLTTRVGSAETNITNYNQARIDGDAALTTTQNSILSRINNYGGTNGLTLESWIAQVNTARVDGDGALTGQFNTLAARMNNIGGSGQTLEARFSSAFQAVTDEAGARASAVTGAYTYADGKVAGVQTSLNTTISNLGVVQNSYGVKLDGGGRAIGFGLNSSNVAASNFVINVDNFIIEKPGGGERTTFANGCWKVFDAAGVARVKIGNLAA